MIQKLLTEEEAELIDAIRNHNDAYPNGYPQLFNYARRLFDEMTSQPK